MATMTLAPSTVLPWKKMIYVAFVLLFVIYRCISMFLTDVSRAVDEISTPHPSTPTGSGIVVPDWIDIPHEVDVDLLAQLEEMDKRMPPLTDVASLGNDRRQSIHKRRLQEKENVPQISRDKYLGLVFPQPEKMPLYLRNTLEPLSEGDLIYYWHVPKAAGGLMKVILGACYGLRRAEKIKEPASLEMVKDTVVNVDTSTPKGIQEAQVLNLADSRMVDVIVTSFVLSGSSLFTRTHRGRAFTLLRHPVDTAASLFWTRKQVRPELRRYTLAQYASQDWYPDNWMVRQLSGALPGIELTTEHFERAKNLLSAKFFIGVVEQMDETMRQLRNFYGLKPLPGKELCASQLIHGANSNFVAVQRPKPKRGNEEWQIVAMKEKWDMELYYFALELFSRQSRLFGGSND